MREKFDVIFQSMKLTIHLALCLNGFKVLLFIYLRKERFTLFFGFGLLQ